MANELSFTQAAALAATAGIAPAQIVEPEGWRETLEAFWNNPETPFQMRAHLASLLSKPAPQRPVQVASKPAPQPAEMQVPVFLAPKTVHENVQPQNLTTEELTMMLRMFFEEENYYMVVEKPAEGPWSYHLARRTT